MSFTETVSGGRSRALLAFGYKVAKLLATVAITFLGLLIVTFIIGRVVPVDPVLAVVGDRASKSTYDAAYIALGLDKPLYEQFFIYLKDAMSGDLAIPFLRKSQSPRISHGSSRRRLNSPRLGSSCTLVGGVPLGGIWGGAVRQGKLPDQIIRVVGLVGYSASIFWLGLLGLLVFYAKLGWVAGPGGLISPMNTPSPRRQACC